jgi:phage gp36-like protein
MAYIEKQDLLNSIQEEHLVSITQGDDSIVTACIAVGESTARTYLADEYNVDAIFAWQSPQPRLQLLVQAIADIAIYHLVARSQAGNYIEDRTARYDRAMKWLRAVQKSELYTELPRRAITAEKKIHFGSRPKRNNYR